jgi:hypothetical protein
MNYRKGLWSPEEDQRLRDYILKHGLGCWSAVPAKAGELLLSFLLSSPSMHIAGACQAHATALFSQKNKKTSFF